MRKILSIIIIFSSFNLLACPFCATDTASEIRSQLFGPDFLTNLSIGILPFVIFAIITIIVWKSGNKIK